MIFSARRTWSRFVKGLVQPRLFEPGGTFLFVRGEREMMGSRGRRLWEGMRDKGLVDLVIRWDGMGGCLDTWLACLMWALAFRFFYQADSKGFFESFFFSLNLESGIVFCD